MKLGIKQSTDANAARTQASPADLPIGGGKGAKKAEAREKAKTGPNGKKPAKIAKRSKKQKAIMKDLKLAYGPYLAKNPVCAIQSPVCTQKATCVNHRAGRGVKQVLDQATWQPSCAACNSYIESHDAWARENGHKISRLK